MFTLITLVLVKQDKTNRLQMLTQLYYVRSTGRVKVIRLYQIMEFEFAIIILLYIAKT